MGSREIRIGSGVQAVPELRTALPEADYVLGVRPEHVQISDSGPVRGEVYGSEYLGTTQVVTINTREGQVRARLNSGVPVKTGEMLGLSFRPEKLSIFARDGGRAIATALHDGGMR
jgi:multiple sugar transport system ATP-binding protein